MDKQPVIPPLETNSNVMTGHGEPGKGQPRVRLGALIADKGSVTIPPDMQGSYEHRTDRPSRMNEAGVRK